MIEASHLGAEENILTILYDRTPGRFTPQTFSTWHHEDTDFTRPAPHDVPFYCTVELLYLRASDRQLRPRSIHDAGRTRRRVAAPVVHELEWQRLVG